jgi:putative ABC transport system ATP-binding protein
MRALSGGEQQRLAVAAALCNEPRLLLADEPTSQLDEDNSARLAELVRAVNRELGATVVMVTHDPMVGAAMERTLTLAAGQLVGVAGPGKGSR